MSHFVLRLVRRDRWRVVLRQEMASEGGLVDLRCLERSTMATLPSGPGVSAVGGGFPRVQPGSSRDRSAPAGNGIQPDPGHWTAGTGAPDSGIGRQMVNG